MRLHLLNYVVMAVYMAALVVIGFWSSGSKSKDSRSFLLGGGKMPALALGISCLMAALSAFSLVMVPGEIFNHGLSFWVLGLITPIFTLVTVRFFIPFYFKLGSYTPYEYLEYRYSAKVRSLVAGLGIYTRLIYLGMVLYSTSKIFEGAAGWPPWISILVIGGFALVFAAVGGLKAVVWTDVLQFIVLVGGLFCIIGFLVAKIDGGIVTAVTCPFQNGHGLANFSDRSFFTGSPYSRLCFWLLLLGYFLTPVSTMCSDQMTIQRLIASGSVKNAVKTQTVNAMLTIPTEIILWFIGLAVFTFFFQHPELPKQEGDTALFFFISTQLPTPIPGLVLSGMMAAVISTLNAVFNGMATVYLKEFHVRYFRPGLPEERQVRVARIATAVIGLLAIALGLLIIYSAKWLRQSVVEASTIFKALEIIVMPAFLFAILSKRASTTLVWVTAGLMWGVKVGTLTWYTLSTAAVAHWEPGMPMGWGGPVRPYAGIAFVALGIVLAWLWCVHRARRRTAFTLMLCSMISFGYAAGLLLWSLFSNTLIKDVPRSLSFQWGGLPLTILYVTMGLLWCRFGPPQPKEKYQGLTLFDSGEVVK